MALPSPPPDRAAPQPLPTGLRMLGWALLVFGMIILVVFVAPSCEANNFPPWPS